MPTPRFSGSFKAPIYLYELWEGGSAAWKAGTEPPSFTTYYAEVNHCFGFLWPVVCQAVTCNCSAAETVWSQLPPKSVLHRSPSVTTMLSNPARNVPHDSGEESLGSLRHVYR